MPTDEDLMTAEGAAFATLSFSGFGLEPILEATNA
jgi:hypothetical protein